MTMLLEHPILLVLIPFVLAVVAWLGGRIARPVAPIAAVLAPLMTAGAGLMALAAVAGTSPGVNEGDWATSGLSAPLVHFGWFTAGESTLKVIGALDSLSAVMLIVVGLVATCVVVFSVGYLADEKGWARYFALIAAFTGSMNLLVIAASFTSLFIGWELVGACSYLLIGFWFERPGASRAALKAFLTTRVGDVGLLLGIAVLWVATGTDTYQGVLVSLPSLDPAVVNAAAVCLAIGAMGKSAQFPLHGWLPDAMEGPTPVSALIHAATMVAAGVYLVVRIQPLFEAAATARTVLLVAGVVSALGAALIATAQRDIKKVLAYSTISQLGFMFAALGVGAWAAAFFHLVTHAAFKALLFLASGSVIHGSGTQDLHEMGGLRRSMPVTFAVWVVGVLALAGVAPLAGFFSKDAVLEAVWHYAPVAAVCLFAASLLTAFYSARATRLAFFGDLAPQAHPHESGWSMLGPLVVLAVPAAALGFAHGGLFDLIGAHAENLSIPISLTATALALTGGTVGWLASAGPAGDTATAARLAPVSGWLADALRWDALVDRVVVGPAVTLSRLLWAWGDRFAADGLVEGLALLARGAGRRIARLHSGDVQAYATGVAAAVALMLAISIWAGR